MTTATTEISIPTPHRSSADLRPHPVPSHALQPKESVVKKPLIPEWVWQMLVGMIASLAIWTHGKLQGTEIALAQHSTRLDRLEMQFEKFDAKLDRLIERVK